MSLEDAAPLSITSERVVLGTLQPGEGKTVYAWTSVAADEWTADRVELTHSEGIGEVRVPQTVGRFWEWMDKWWVALIPTVAWLMYVAWKLSRSRLVDRDLPDVHAPLGSIPVSDIDEPSPQHKQRRRSKKGPP